MNKIIIIFLLGLIFNISNTNNSYAIGAGVFKSIFKLFSKNADEATTVIKKGDEALSGSKVKNAEMASATIAEEATIINKIGKDAHQSHYNSIRNDSLKNIKLKHGLNVGRTIKKMAKEGGENIFDLYELAADATSEQKKFYDFIIFNWIGKIYRFSNYYNNPNYENRTLLICKNTNEVFYFTILMDNEGDVNRAFLTEHKYFTSSNKTLDRQELLIIRDEKFVKIMSLKLSVNKMYPSNYFTIFDNQNFIHDIGGDPDIIIKNGNKQTRNFIRNSKCYKANKDGLMIASNN